MEFEFGQNTGTCDMCGEDFEPAELCDKCVMGSYEYDGEIEQYSAWVCSSCCGCDEAR